MTHKLLETLYQSAKTLTGVGPKSYEALQRIGCTRIIDLIFYLPYNLNQYQYMPDLSKVITGSNIVTKVILDDTNFAKNYHYRNRSNIFKIACSNDTGMIYIIYLVRYSNGWRAVRGSNPPIKFLENRGQPLAQRRIWWLEWDSNPPARF